MSQLTHQALREAIAELATPARQGQCLEIYDTNAPESSINPRTQWKIRYMATAGGPQFCWKIVSWRGEGSGYYEPLERLEIFSDFVFAEIIRRAEGAQRLTKLTNRAGFVAAIRFAPDVTQPAPFAKDLENTPMFKDATVITLEASTGM